jgi:hypothetical protein
VKPFLVTYDYTLGGSVDRLSKFARSLCQNSEAAGEGHPKWREVTAGRAGASSGMALLSTMQRELKTCIADMQSKPAAPVCTQQARILGLCK